MTNRRHYTPAPPEVIAAGPDAHVEWLREHCETRPAERVNCPAVTMEREWEQMCRYDPPPDVLRDACARARLIGWGDAFRFYSFESCIAWMSLLTYLGRMGEREVWCPGCGTLITENGYCGYC